MYEKLIILLLFVAGAYNTSNAQGLSNAFDGICRVETNDGRGTGFVVAKTAGRFEVWTNAHVAGKVGQRIVARFDVGRKSERAFKGVVSWAEYSSSVDASKLIVVGDYGGDVFRISDCADCGVISVTGGHPLGLRAYAVALSPFGEADFGQVRAYRPPSIEGQSGSPVVNERGDVIGVVTLRMGKGKNAVGGMLPISQWTRTGSKPVSVLGFGDFKPLGKAVVD